MANSVYIPSDARTYIFDSALLEWVPWDGSLTTGALTIGAVTQGGTWTVQPGNTANTTAWKVDGSEVTQPVSIAGTVPVSSATLATAANQATEIASLSSIDGKTPALGQQLAAASSPVVLTAAQISTLTPPAAITGFLTEADFDTKTGSLTEAAPATDTASSGLNGRLQRIAQRITSLITALGSPFQAGGSIGNTTFAATQATAASLNATVVGTGTFAAQVTGTVTANAGTNLNTSALALDASISTLNTSVNTLLKPANTLAAVTTVGTITNPVAVTSAGLTNLDVALSTRTKPADQQHAIVDSGTLTTVSTVTAVTSITNTVPTKELRAATPAQTTVADSATNVTILASNANRLGATIANDSSAVLYLKLGATASTTSYTVRMAQYGYFETPFGYTGVIEGLWATDPGDGAARVTEVAA